MAYWVYQRKLRRAKAIERGLKMVPILIHLPPPSNDTASGSRDMREVMREKTAQAEVLYDMIAGVTTEGLKAKLYGQRHIALELIAANGLVHFFIAVPVALVSVVEKAILTAYPGARLEQVEDHNIFNQDGRLAATMGGEMVLRSEAAYPVATYREVERDPLEALLTTLSAMGKDDGAAVQIMLRPASPNWVKRSISLVSKLRKGRHSGIKFGVADVAKAAWKAPVNPNLAQPGGVSATGQVMAPVPANLSNLELSVIEAVEEKTKHPGFEVLVRVLVSSGSVARSQQVLRDLATAFALFERPGLNGFKFLPALDVQGLVTAFIFRFFPPELRSNLLNSQELATLFHLPDSQFTPASNIGRQQSKQVDGPVQLPAEGLLFGYNEFRGVKKEIRLSREDRRRHTYILGQTGTGKSTLLENLAVQDMLSGNGFAFIDPHGDTAEKLLAMVPKQRAEDVIYFNPADTEYPLGLNLFEFSDPTQKDFIVQETINMLYKLYDPGHTGIIGPRYEHWYRNAALTLMSDPNGATFIEIPKVFTDTDYLKQKFRYLKDPTVIDFWTKEMGQTSDYHKSEMLGWFVSKFGAFQNNEMMRNIIGQTKSAFNLREVMDQKKILIVNLSKGRVGELNSQLLGMMFVIKFQAAAMSRADMAEDMRPDFSLYVDEFQNFSTDSFASILSEARKYRLNLVVANQFIGQLSEQIRDAVFGNIGTIVAHRMGPEDAEFMVKQFAPAFDASDLVNLPNYNAAMRLMVGGVPSAPFTMQNLPPLGTANLELGLAVKQLSAAKYGLAKNVVEADILMRLSSGQVPLPAPAAPAPVMEAPAPASAASSAAVSAPVPAPAPAPAATTPPTPTLEPVAAVTVPETKPEPEASVAPAVPVITAPPIGAPPIDLPPVPTAVPAAPAPAPVAPAVLPTALAVPEAPPAAAPTVPAPAPTVAIAAAPDPTPPVLDRMAEMPPPIGSAPVDLNAPAGTAPAPVTMVNTAGQPMEPALGAARPADAGALTISDITGGKMPVAAAGAGDLLNVPLVPPGSGPVVTTTVPAAAPVAVSEQVPAAVPAYDPMLDPMADVPLMGEAAEPVAPQPPAPPAPVLSPLPDVPVAATAPPRVAEPVAAEPVVTPVTRPVPPVPPKPAEAVVAPVQPVVEPVAEAPEPAPQPEAQPQAEDLIHFVDPKLETVLERPVAEVAAEPVVLPNADSGASASLAAVVEGVKPEPSAPGEPVAAPAVADLPNPMERMTETPPPIGAAPVDLPAPAPSAAEKPSEGAEPQAPATPVQEQLVAPEAAQVESATLAAEPKPEATPAAEPATEPVPAPPTAPAEPAPNMVPATEPVLAPNPVSSPIAKAEETIDELLSESLIHPDSKGPRLPELTEEKSATPSEAKSEKSAGGRHWLEPTPSSAESPMTDLTLAEPAATAAPAPALEPRPAFTASRKVIQPLEPIVPIHDEIVRQAEEIISREAAAPAPEVAPGLEPEAGQQLPVVPPEAPVEEPIAAEETAAPTAAAPEESEPELPAAESLAATDVAKAKAEAAVAPETAPEPQQPAAEEKPRRQQHRRNHAKAAEPRPVASEEAPAPEPAAPEAASEQPAAEPAETTGQEQQTGPMTGQLIMPSAPKPEAADETATPSAKPPKLAKGEVYVDEHGNVIIGE